MSLITSSKEISLSTAASFIGTSTVSAVRGRPRLRFTALAVSPSVPHVHGPAAFLLRLSSSSSLVPLVGGGDEGREDKAVLEPPSVLLAMCWLNFKYLVLHLKGARAKLT